MQRSMDSRGCISVAYRRLTLPDAPLYARFGLLVWPLAAAGLAVFTAWHTPLTGQGWLRFGVLTAVAVVQAEVTRNVEESRRRFAAQMPHISMTSAWLFAGALTLSLPLAITLVFVLQAHLYLRAWRAATRDETLLNRTAFNTGMLGGAVAAAHLVVAGTAWEMPALTHSTGAVLLVVAAAVAHFAVNAAICYLGLCLRGQASLLTFLLRLHETSLEWALLALGAVIGLLAGESPLVMLLLLVPVIVLHRAVLTKQLETAASTDAKTGLANAAAWHGHADRALDQAGRAKQQVALFMVDLDHFKRVNDTHGHYAGDAVLVALGELLRTELRRNDVAGRFGGEEFAVLLPASSVADAMAVAERIRVRVTELAVETEDNTGAPVVIDDLSASIGVAMYPDHGGRVHQCLRRADEYVYAAKDNGRNQVVGINPTNLVSLREPA